MNGSLKHDHRAADLSAPAWRADMVSRPNFGAKRQPAIGGTMATLPKRPDLSVLSASIPLFYIGRNRLGFWVARESEGRSGGLFLTQRSAVRFARSQSVPVGCATMFLSETFELDIDNQGSRLIGPLTDCMDLVARRAPLLASYIGLAVAEWRKLVAEVARALAGERRNRAAIERELFRGEYRLISKGDDDLPAVGS